MGRPEIGRFLESVAQTEKDPVPAVAAGREALDFLYREVRHLGLGELPLPRPPRLLDQARPILRVRHYALRTEECYLQWMTRFILFHRKRHPRDMGAAEVEQLLTDLAVKGHVSPSTQNQALNALGFLYQEVLEQDSAKACSSACRAELALRQGTALWQSGRKSGGPAPFACVRCLRPVGTGASPYNLMCVGVSPTPGRDGRI